MASICFNCKKPAFHRSVHCPYAQEFERCPSCNKVAFNKSGHEFGCGLRDQFISTKSNVDSNVFEIDDIFSLQFKHVADFRIVNGNRSIEIGTKPISLNQMEMFVTNVDSKVVFTASSPTQKNVIIVDGDDKPIMWMTYNGAVFVVNSRYEILRNGYVKYKYNVGAALPPKDGCKIKVINVQPIFNVRVSIFDIHPIFDVYPTGAILRDPQSKVAEAALRADEERSRNASDENNQKPTDILAHSAATDAADAKTLEGLDAIDKNDRKSADILAHSAATDAKTLEGLDANDENDQKSADILAHSAATDAKILQSLDASVENASSGGEQTAAIDSVEIKPITNDEN